MLFFNKYIKLINEIFICIVMVNIQYFSSLLLKDLQLIEVQFNKDMKTLENLTTDFDRKCEKTKIYNVITQFYTNTLPLDVKNIKPLVFLQKMKEKFPNVEPVYSLSDKIKLDTTTNVKLNELISNINNNSNEDIRQFAWKLVNLRIQTKFNCNLLQVKRDILYNNLYNIKDKYSNKIMTSGQSDEWLIFANYIINDHIFATKTIEEQTKKELDIKAKDHTTFEEYIDENTERVDIIYLIKLNNTLITKTILKCEHNLHYMDATDYRTARMLFDNSIKKYNNLTCNFLRIEYFAKIDIMANTKAAQISLLYNIAKFNNEHNIILESEQNLEDLIEILKKDFSFLKNMDDKAIMSENFLTDFFSGFINLFYPLAKDLKITNWLKIIDLSDIMLHRIDIDEFIIEIEKTIEIKETITDKAIAIPTFVNTTKKLKKFILDFNTRYNNKITEYETLKMSDYDFYCKQNHSNLSDSKPNYMNYNIFNKNPIINNNTKYNYYIVLIILIITILIVLVCIFFFKPKIENKKDNLSNQHLENIDNNTIHDTATNIIPFSQITTELV